MDTDARDVPCKAARKFKLKNAELLSVGERLHRVLAAVRVRVLAYLRGKAVGVGRPSAARALSPEQPWCPAVAQDAV